MPKRKKQKSLKHCLIETTIRHIEEFGPEKISLRKIAAECGVTHASVYKHFEDKQALIFATYPYILDQLYPYIGAYIAEHPQQHAFISVSKAYVLFMLEYPSYHYLLHISPGSHTAWQADHENNVMRQFLRHYTPLLQDFMAAYGVPPEEETVLSLLIATILEGIVTLINKGNLAIDGNAEQLVDILLLEKLNLKPV